MRKNRLIFAFAICNLLATAQFNQLKNKIDKAKSSKTESNEEVKANGPAEKEISDFKREYPSVENKVKKGYNDAGGGLNMLAELIEKIKSKDPGNKDVAKMESQYNDLVKIHSDRKQGDNEADYLNSVNFKVQTLLKSSDKWNSLKKCAAELNYSEYSQHKQKFLSANSSGSSDKRVMQMDKFYNEQFDSEVMPSAKTSVLAEIKEQEKKYLTRADEVKTDLEKMTALLDLVGKIAPQNVDIKLVQKECSNLQAKVDKYISSGEYNKWLESEKQARLNEVKLEPAKMTDPSVNAVVKSKMDKATFGEPAVIHIVTSEWEVKKNDLGVPIDKNVRVEVATKMNGKCYLHHLWVRKPYEGGGKYGAMYVEESEFLQEMSCSNAK